MKRGQVFVRAINKKGKHDSVDVLDLDDASFKAFVMDMLFSTGIVVGLRDEAVDGERIVYREKK